MKIPKNEKLCLTWLIDNTPKYIITQSLKSGRFAIYSIASPLNTLVRLGTAGTPTDLENKYVDYVQIKRQVNSGKD